MDEQNQKNTSETENRRDRIRKNFFGGIDEDKKAKNEKRQYGTIASILIGLLNILVIISAVLLVRVYLVTPFSVVGSSMEPNFFSGNLILVDKLSYRFHEPERGDVVVFFPPIPKEVEKQGIVCIGLRAWTFLFESGTKNPCVVQEHFVKRVIGVPGDTVEIQNGQVFVTPKGGDRQRVSDAFLSPKNQNRTCFATTTCQSQKDVNGVFVEVEEGTVYVLGDNRTGSSDSRAWSKDGKPTPLVPIESIAGKVRFIFWPFSSMSVVENPEMFVTQE